MNTLTVVLLFIHWVFFKVFPPALPFFLPLFSIFFFHFLPLLKDRTTHTNTSHWLQIHRTWLTDQEGGISWTSSRVSSREAHNFKSSFFPQHFSQNHKRSTVTLSNKAISFCNCGRTSNSLHRRYPLPLWKPLTVPLSILIYPKVPCSLFSCTQAGNKVSLQELTTTYVYPTR